MESDAKTQSVFRWSAPVNTPIEMFLSMGEHGLTAVQNGAVVARTANLTYVPEAPTNLTIGEPHGLPAELTGLQFIPMPISAAQMTYFNFI